MEDKEERHLEEKDHVEDKEERHLEEKKVYLEKEGMVQMDIFLREEEKAEYFGEILEQYYVFE